MKFVLAVAAIALCACKFVSAAMPSCEAQAAGMPRGRDR